MEKVLVTGASGYIAEHCIIELLKNGYAVKGSLRNMNREPEVRTAIKTAIDDNNLEFCELDLLKDDGWSDAMVDCDFVMHCLLYTSPSPRDRTRSRMPSSA